MNAMRAGLVIIALAGLGRPVQAQSVQDSVRAAVADWFRAMTARDSAATGKLQTAEGSAIALVRQGDTVAIRHRTNQAWLRQLAVMRDTIVERFWEPTVLVHGPLAVLWTPYDIYRNGSFLHCGVDAFTLVRSASGWRIATVVYTVEPAGCPPSPLGPLPGGRNP